MSVFDREVPRRLLWPASARWPKRRAHSLIRSFRQLYSEIIYDVEMGVLVANAQALKLAGVRTVRLYGGLILHRNLLSSGLAVILAHETGHHLGGSPFHPAYRWLSSEERATEWACQEGLVQVFGKDQAKRVADEGMKNLDAIARNN